MIQQKVLIFFLSHVGQGKLPLYRPRTPRFFSSYFVRWLSLLVIDKSLFAESYGGGVEYSLVARTFRNAILNIFGTSEEKVLLHTRTWRTIWACKFTGTIIMKTMLMILMIKNVLERIHCKWIRANYRQISYLTQLKISPCLTSLHSPN